MVAKVKTAATADYSKVSLAGGKDAAAHIGNVPTLGGVQQQMCLLMLHLGTTAGKEKKFDYNFGEVVDGFVSTYYGPGKGVGRSKPPTEDSLKNMRSAYGRWGLAGMQAFRHVPWDATKLAHAAIECGLNSLGARASVIRHFMEEKGRTSAPTPAEVQAHIAEKIAKQNKTKSGGGKGKDAVAEWTAASVTVAVRTTAMGMGGDANLQKFLKANGLGAKFDAMITGMSEFATALELTLSTDKGKASEKKIRAAMIAAAQKAQPAEGAKPN
jgi:hypothetical protein